MMGNIVAGDFLYSDGVQAVENIKWRVWLGLWEKERLEMIDWSLKLLVPYIFILIEEGL